MVSNVNRSLNQSIDQIFNDLRMCWCRIMSSYIRLQCLSPSIQLCPQYWQTMEHEIRPGQIWPALVEMKISQVSHEQYPYPSDKASWLIGFPTMGYHNPQWTRYVPILTNQRGYFEWLKRKTVMQYLKVGSVEHIGQVRDKSLAYQGTHKWLSLVSNHPFFGYVLPSGNLT